MKLYASAASSFAREIRVMMLEKGVEHELELVNLWEPNQLHHVNPLGKVPALKLDDGRVLVSSGFGGRQHGCGQCNTLQNAFSR